MTDAELLDKGLIRRWLADEEYLRPDIRSIFHTEGTTTPIPAMSRIAVLEEVSSGRIVALCTFQLAAHAEPIWVDQDLRGKGLAQEVGAMIDRFLMESQVSTVFTLPSRPVSCHLAKKFGFTPYSEAWIKHYIPEEKE